MLPNVEDIAALVRALDEARAEIGRLRAQYAAQIGVTEVWQRETSAERARAEQAEADVEHWKEQLRAEVERSQARLREVDVALRESGLVLFQPTGGKLCVLRLKAAAQPEKGPERTPEESPNSIPKELEEFKARGYERINRAAAQPKEPFKKDV